MSNKAKKAAAASVATETSTGQVTEQQAGATTKAVTHLADTTETVADGMTDELQSRFDDLFATRFYKDQTRADLAKVVINAGIKAVEKRRKDTDKNQVAKATAILEARGLKVVESAEDADVPEVA